jgi:prepilin-type processing-associated H-X9-DG protein
MDYQHIGSLVYLLPYMDQQSTFDNFAFGEDDSGPWWSPGVYHWFINEKNYPADGSVPLQRPRPGDGKPSYGGEGKINTFLCPATPQNYITVIYSTAYMAPDQGISTFPPPPHTAPYTYLSPDNFFYIAAAPAAGILGRTNYLGMGGYPYADAGDGTPGTYTGILTWNTTVTFAEVTDGTSNTILYAEYAGGGYQGQPNQVDGLGSGSFGASWGCGPFYTYWGPDSGSYTEYYRFGAAHLNVFNVCFADGSVRSLKNSIDYNLWVTLGGYRDGQVITGLDQ